MIFLIGTPRWMSETKRLMSDRTSHSRRVFTADEVYNGAARGTLEHVEVIIDGHGRTLTLIDTYALQEAEMLNKTWLQDEIRRQRLDPSR